MKTIALESVDFFQREWNCLEKHEDSDSMSRVVVGQQIVEYILLKMLEKYTKGTGK